MSKKKCGSLIVMGIGLLLSIITLMLPTAQNAPHASAANLQVTPTPTPLPGLRVGATASFTDISVSGQQDTAVVTRRDLNHLVALVTIPGTHPVQYQVGFLIPPGSNRLAAYPELDFLRRVNNGTATDMPLTHITQAMLNAENQLGGPVRSLYYHDGYRIVQPPPNTPAGVTQWVIQAYDATVGRLRTVTVNHIDATTDDLDTIRRATDAQVQTERYNLGLGTAGLVVLIGLLTNMFAQPVPLQVIGVLLFLLLWITTISLVVYNILSSLASEHQRALAALNDIVNRGLGAEHELTPIPPPPSPPPTPTH